jgi:hypothetical protein
MHIFYQEKKVNVTLLYQDKESKYTFSSRRNSFTVITTKVVISLLLRFWKLPFPRQFPTNNVIKKKAKLQLK